MPSIKLQTLIKANRNIVFDLSRSIDLQSKFVTGSNEKAVAGKTSGLISLDEIVTYRGKHLGVWQNLTSRVTDFDRPQFFVDEWKKVLLKVLDMNIISSRQMKEPIMNDVFGFESPLGVLGKLANTLFLKSYMTNFLKNRNKTIKEFAESGRWKELLPENNREYNN